MFRYDSNIRSVLYLENVSKGGGGKTEVPRNKGGEPGVHLFSVIYAILIGIRLDEFPGGGGGGGGEKKARGVNAPPPQCL